MDRKGQIGSIIATLAAVVAIVVGGMEIYKWWQGRDVPISAQLQTSELEPKVPQEDYLQQSGKSTKGYSAKQLQELGVQVTAGADVEGLKGDKLTLRYTVHDVTDNSRVPELENKNAEKFVPDSSHYDRDFVVFVPYPPRAGEYYVSLSLHNENGVQLDQMDTDGYPSFFAGPQPAEDPIKVLERLYDTDTMQPEQGELERSTVPVGAGGLQMEGPSEWKDTNKIDWQIEQLGDIGTALLVSPDLVNGVVSSEGWETPRAFLGASSDLMLPPPEGMPEWNYLNRYEDHSEDCEREGRYNYIGARLTYEGHYDVWKECNGTDATIVCLVAWNKYNSSYITSVRIHLTGEADIEAAKAVLDSFAAYPPAPTESGPPERTTAGPETTMQGPPERTTAGPNEKASVEATVRSYYEAIGVGDFEEAYSYIGPTYKKMIDYNKQIWIDSQESEQITDSTINSVNVQRVSGNTATATVDVAFQEKGKDSRFFLEWILVEEGGEWKLDEQRSGERI